MSAFSLPIMPMPGTGGSSLGGFHKHRYGNSNVSYDDEGRLIHHGRHQAAYPHPDDDDRYSYDSRREKRKSLRRDDGYGPPRDRRYEPRRGPYPQDPYSGTHPGAAPVPRRPQPYMLPANRLRQPPMQTMQMAHPARMNGTPTIMEHQPTVYPPPPRSDYNHRAEDNRTYDMDRHRGVRPMWIMFLFNGTLMLILGVLNILFCEEWHHYFRFWTGLVILEVGIVGLLHRGNYYQQWQNWSYMLSGLLAALLSFVGTGLLLVKLAPQITLIDSSGDMDKYIDYEEARTDVDTVVDVSTKTRVWVCLAVDCTSQLSLLGGMAAMVGVCHLAERFWKNNYPVYGVMSPFCLPWLFNSYSQILWAELVAFLGLVTVYGCADVATPDTEWHEYWGPVWSGAVTAIAGGVTVAAIKRDDLIGVSVMALIWQVLSLLTSIAAFAFGILGIIDDKDYLDDTQISFQERYIRASACLFALTNLVLLVAMFYSAHGLYRVVKSMQKSLRSTRQGPQSAARAGNPLHATDYDRYGQDRWQKNAWPRREDSRY